MGDSPVEVVDSFCYLGDVVRYEGGAEAVVRGRIACAWKSWRELASLLVNQNTGTSRFTRGIGFWRRRVNQIRELDKDNTQ